MGIRTGSQEQRNLREHTEKAKWVPTSPRKGSLTKSPGGPPAGEAKRLAERESKPKTKIETAVGCISQP